MSRPSTSQLVSFVLLLPILIHQATSLCECGYSTTIDGKRHVFRDLLESNFAGSKPYNIKHSSDWQRQAFNLSKDRARGQYGEAFVAENTGMTPDGGLGLTVSHTLVDGMVPVAEIDYYRGDLHYGTFRASLKLSSISGTCAAFFWVCPPFPASILPTRPAQLMAGQSVLQQHARNRPRIPNQRLQPIQRQLSRQPRPTNRRLRPSALRRL